MPLNDWFLDPEVEHILRVPATLWMNQDRVDEVARFAELISASSLMAFNALGMDPAHPSLDKVRERAELMGEVLHEVGARHQLGSEVNFYTTMGHSPRATDIAFAPVIGDDGLPLNGIPCPMEPDFLVYIKQAYGLYAEHVGGQIWIDDDLRLEQFPGPELECLCGRHLAEFGRRVGGSWTRQDVVDLLRMEPEQLSEAQVGLRVIWRQVQADGLIEVCRVLAEACRPTAVARMTCGGYPSHIRTGCDFDRELRVLATDENPRPMVRMGGAVYHDDRPMDNLYGQLNLDADSATIAAPCRPATELESFPFFPGQKSVRVLSLEMTTATASFGANHTFSLLEETLTEFDPSGQFGQLGTLRTRLTQLKRAIKAVIEDGGRRRGASQLVWTDPRAAARRSQLVAPNLRWNLTLAQLGVPLNPHDPDLVVIDVDEARSGESAALEQAARTGMLVSSEAYQILRSRGLLAGCPIEVHDRHDDGLSFEREMITLPGRSAEWALTWIWCKTDNGRLIRPLPGATVWATLERLGADSIPSAVVTEAASGYRVGVVAHRLPELRDPRRQRLFQTLFAQLSGVAVPWVRDALNVAPVVWQSERETVLVLLNYGHEDFPGLTVELPWPAGSVEELDAEGVWQSRPAQGDRLAVPVGALAATILRLRAEGH